MDDNERVMPNLTLLALLVVSILNTGERDASQFCAFHAKLSRVVDGDTVIADPLSASMCSTVSGKKTPREFADGFPYHIRLIGIDTPERGEKGFRKARRFALKWFEDNPQFMVVYAVASDTPTLGKYGRLLATIVPIDRPPVSLNADLLAAGLAKAVHYTHNDTINFLEWQIRKNSESISSEPTAP